MYTLRCRDVGFDCEGVVRAETKDAVLAQAAQHAEQVHGVKVTPEIAQKVAGLIAQERDQG